MDLSPAPVLFPKLRAVSIQPCIHEGQPCFLVEDPLELNGGGLIVPQSLGPILALCDGSQADVQSIEGTLGRRYGIGAEPGVVESVLAALDHSFLLENLRFEQAVADRMAAYRQAPCRPPSLAGQAYPADAEGLSVVLNAYLAQAPSRNGSGPQGGTGQMEAAAPVVSGRGLFSPHIDYARGWPTYAGVWKTARPLVEAAELVILFATDHRGADLFTLTGQHYATPYGILPTDREAVDRLAQRISPAKAFAGEMRHEREHSVELAAVWLHHMRRHNPPPLIPILTGGLHEFYAGPRLPDQAAAIAQVLDLLAEMGQERRVLVIASGDMAHVGPAFGGRPLNPEGEARLQAADQGLLRHLEAGDAQGFFRAIARVQDRNNVCGVTPFYLALSLMERIRRQPVQGHVAHYARCPADAQNTSAVTVCGVVY